METHDVRLVRQQHRQHGIVFHEASVDFPQPRRRFCAKPFEVRTQALEPGRLERVVDCRGPMTEDIYVEERSERSRTAAIILRAPSASVAPTPIDPSAPASYRRRHRRRGHSGHRGLNDRKIDSQRLEQCHLLTPAVPAASHYRMPARAGVHRTLVSGPPRPECCTARSRRVMDIRSRAVHSRSLASHFESTIVYRAEPKSTRMSHETPTVFVVDDDVSVRESLEMLIRCAGWQPELSRPQSNSSLAHGSSSPPIGTSKFACERSNKAPWNAKNKAAVARCNTRRRRRSGPRRSTITH